MPFRYSDAEWAKIEGELQRLLHWPLMHAPEGFVDLMSTSPDKYQSGIDVLRARKRWEIETIIDKWRHLGRHNWKAARKESRATTKAVKAIQEAYKSDFAKTLFPEDGTFWRELELIERKAKEVEAVTSKTFSHRHHTEWLADLLITVWLFQGGAASSSTGANDQPSGPLIRFLVAATAFAGHRKLTPETARFYQRKNAKGTHAGARATKFCKGPVCRVRGKQGAFGPQKLANSTTSLSS